MKKIIAMLVPVLFVFSCKNVEQFRAPIEALSADWEKATTAVTEVGGMIGATQTTLANLKDSFMIDPIKAAKLKSEITDSLSSFKLAYTTQVDGLMGMASEVTTFAGSWQQMSVKLSGLKDGLASGKLDGDVIAQVNELKTAAMNAASKADGWKKKMIAAKSTAMAAFDMYSKMKTRLMSSK